jgi:GNAT superfamily N-acetyltransferase
MQLDLELLPGGYSVSKLPPGVALPDWLAGVGLINVTFAADETSVVCLTAHVPQAVQTVSGWAAIKVTINFGFDEAGVVLAAIQPISGNGAGVFVLSTYDRDYLLVRATDLAQVQGWLRAAGHRFIPHIGRAALADAPAIADFHDRIWQQTYRHIAPATVCAKLDAAHRLVGWRSNLGAEKPRAATLIARAEGQIVGLICVAPATQPALGGGGEVKHLYVAPEMGRTGLGRRLMAEGFAHLRRSGFSTASLAVVAGSEAALAFYQALGGQIVGSFTDAGPLWPSDNLIVSFDISG